MEEQRKEQVYFEPVTRNIWGAPIVGRYEAAKIAATLPNKNLAELMDNTVKVQKWLEEGV